MVFIMVCQIGTCERRPSSAANRGSFAVSANCLARWVIVSKTDARLEGVSDDYITL